MCIIMRDCETNNQLLNEAVYKHSANRANSSSCIKRFNYWFTIHKHRAEALNKPSLVNEVKQAIINAPSECAMLRKQAF